MIRSLRNTVGTLKIKIPAFLYKLFSLCIFQNKYYLYHYLICFTVYYWFFLPSTFHIIKSSFEKNLSQTPFLITVWSILFSFHFFHPLWNLKFMVKSQKKWWALCDKWEIWIDTSWLALYNALRFEKMQKPVISEHTFYINCFTLLIQRCQLLKIKCGWNANPASQPANYSKFPKWSPGMKTLKAFAMWP